MAIRYVLLSHDNKRADGVAYIEEKHAIQSCKVSNKMHPEGKYEIFKFTDESKCNLIRFIILDSSDGNVDNCAYIDKAKAERWLSLWPVDGARIVEFGLVDCTHQLEIPVIEYGDSIGMMCRCNNTIKYIG